MYIYRDQSPLRKLLDRQSPLGKAGIVAAMIVGAPSLIVAVGLWLISLSPSFQAWLIAAAPTAIVVVIWAALVVLALWLLMKGLE